MASSVLSYVLSRLREDWRGHYRVDPLLLETLVDWKRYHGGCYRAANWIELGKTSGRGRMDRAGKRHGADVKTILVYPLVKNAVRRLAAKNSFDEVVESIAKTTGGNVPKRQAEEVVQRAARGFDAFYDVRKCCCSEEETTGSVLAITADGKGVVLHERDLRGKIRKAAEKRRQKMGKRRSKGEKKRVNRNGCIRDF